MRSLLLWVSLSLTAARPQDSFPITKEDGSLKKVYDVIIVGAGLTGLSTARRIKENSPNASVLILEARGQAGGRIRSRSMSTALGDVWVDLGSQFISRDHLAISNLAFELGIDLIPQTMCGERSVLIEGVRRKRQVSWSSYLSIRPSFDDVISSPDLSLLSQQSVGEFVNTTNQSPADSSALNRLLQTLYDAPEDSISALNVALTAGSENATVSELLLNNGHGLSLLVDGGMNRLVRTMADGFDIEYNQQVVSINQDSSPASVVTSSSLFEGRQIVVTVPPAVASGLRYFPPLNQDFSNFIADYKPSGHAFYFTLVYPTTFWRSMNKSGQVIYTSSTSKLAWLTTFDMTTDPQCVSSMGVSGILWGIAHFFDGSLTEEERHNLYIEAVAKSLETEIVPLDVKDVQFSSDIFALGSIGVLKPSFDLTYLQYLKGVNSEGDSLHFASAEFSNVSMGLMNGAILAGQLAGDRVISNLAGSDSGVQADSFTGILFDSPVPQNDENTTQAPAVQGTTPFVYKTSSHYPPEYLNSNSTKKIVGNQVQRDSPVTTSFNYETSSHYPPTEAIETTTYTHFSAGNLESSTENSIVQNDMGVEGIDTSTSFVYRTSSHYPPSGPIETTTYKHFSMGNLDEEEPPAKMILGPAADELRPSTISPNTATNFVYRTSSHYPPSGTIKTTTYKHFSRGNLDDEEPPAKMILGPAAEESSPSTISPDTATNFVYRTSSHYPPSGPIETSTYKHFSRGNLDDEEPPAKMVLGPQHASDPSTKSPDTANTFDYRTSSHYPPSGPIETSTYKHFSRGNLEDDGEAPANMVAGPVLFDQQNSSVTSDTAENDSYSTPPSTVTSNTAATFEYRTSSQYPLFVPVETTTYKHFSMGNLESTDLTSLHVNNIPQQDSPPAAQPAAAVEGYADSGATAAQPAGQVASVAGPAAPEIIEDLQEVVAQAPATSQLNLASQLTSIVQRLIQAVQGLTRR